MWLCRSFVAFPFDLVVLQCARGRRMTQAQLHAVTRGNVSLYTDSSFLPKRRMQANLSFSDAHSPRQREVLNTALSRARIHEERRELAGHWLGAHTMARRLCEAARRRQARVTASARLGRSFDDRTRRRVGAQTRRHPACMRQCAVPPRGAERGRKSAGMVVFTALPKLRCVTSQYKKGETRR